METKVQHIRRHCARPSHHCDICLPRAQKREVAIYRTNSRIIYTICSHSFVFADHAGLGVCKANVYIGALNYAPQAHTHVLGAKESVFSIYIYADTLRILVGKTATSGKMSKCG